MVTKRFNLNGSEVHFFICARLLSPQPSLPSLSRVLYYVIIYYWPDISCIVKAVTYEHIYYNDLNIMPENSLFLIHNSEYYN